MATGYDYEPKTSGGLYLRLKSKGDRVKVRLVSPPYHFTEEWDGESKDAFAWLVLDREDGNVKTYKASVSVYKQIRGYANDEEWGDPSDYDLTITRTEEKPMFYVVSPSPNKKPLTAEEKAKVAAFKKEPGHTLEEMHRPRPKDGTPVRNDGFDPFADE